MSEATVRKNTLPQRENVQRNRDQDLKAKCGEILKICE